MNNFTFDNINNLKKATLVISLLLFCASLTQVAFYANYTEVQSLYALLFGFLVATGAGFSWLANPFLILSWILMFKNPKHSLFFSFLTVALSLSFLLFKEVVINEAGSPSDISSYGPGYWLWLSSCIVNCIGVFIIENITKKNLPNSTDL